MDKPKVIILYNKLFHYRIPIWNHLAEKCDLTVAHSDPNAKVSQGFELKFKTLYLPARTFMGRVVLQKANIRKLVKDYDAVIVYGDISWLKYSTLSWFGKNKVVFHTLGVSAFYDRGYDQISKWDKVRAFFYKHATALAFYTDYPVEKYAAMGIPREKMFVAHNTVAVQPIAEPVQKNSILFIGTLYREKGIQNLLDAYKRLRGKCALPLLNIVGKGPDYDFVKQWIEANGMSDLIHLPGAVYDITEKAEYFARAYACVSPLQAGLTVQESMGYGVPFVTVKNAITGGEIFDIKNGENGVLMDDVSELDSVIEDIAKHPEKFVELGRQAQIFYNEHSKPSDMAEGLWKAVCYAINKQ